MPKTQTSLRYYIDRDQDHAVVRAVPVARVASPATHRADTPTTPPEAPRLRAGNTGMTPRARMGQLMQQAIRRYR